MSVEFIEIITTTAEQADAQRLAKLLLDLKLAACTQILGPLESSYWWNHQIQTVREWQLIIKTRRDYFDRVNSELQTQHPYDEPEIIAVPLVAMSSGYRGWLESQLAETPAKTATASVPKSKS